MVLLRTPASSQHRRVLVGHNGLSRCRERAHLYVAVPQDWTTSEIDCTWAVEEGPSGLERALNRICDDADAAVEAGARFILLTDRAAGVVLDLGSSSIRTRLLR